MVEDHHRNQRDRERERGGEKGRWYGTTIKNKNNNNNKYVGFVTTCRLVMINETYGIEKYKKKVLLKSQKNI